MPNMNGYQAAQRIRKLPHLKDVNIVGVTAYVDDEIIETCRKCGMNAVVQKPVKLAELADALNARTPNAPVKIPNFEKYVDLCLRDISEAIVAAKSALKKKDFGTIVDVIHPVQGAASMLSMGSLAGALRDLEALARVQSDHIGLAIEDVQLELEKLKQAKPTEGVIKS
jgi:response regulator RpfG family c-di-GMP phosphodiesterase